MSPHTRQELFDMLARPDKSFMVITSYDGPFVVGRVRAVELVGCNRYDVTVDTILGPANLNIKTLD